jgi:hypothetical protein
LPRLETGSQVSENPLATSSAEFGYRRDPIYGIVDKGVTYVNNAGHGAVVALVSGFVRKGRCDRVGAAI